MRTEHLPEGEPQPLVVDGQTIITAAVFERPAAERPAHDTIEGIGDWLMADARRAESFLHMFDELGWRLLAAGIHVVEHLTNLDALPPRGARFTSAPPAVERFGTFPVRAFATI